MFAAQRSGETLIYLVAAPCKGGTGNVRVRASGVGVVLQVSPTITNEKTPSKRALHETLTFGQFDLNTVR